MIECKGLVKIFDSNTDSPCIALDHINYKFPDAGLFGITGPSGSGKSTFLHCLSTLIYPSQGEIKYNGTDYGNLSLVERCVLRRKKFGIIFQKDFLIPYLDCLSNIIVGENDHAQSQEAKNLMNRLGISNGVYAYKYPAALSGGQRQRISIARGLIGNPKVVFADEPTASLDKVSAGMVMELFKEASKKALIIIVTHDMGVMCECTTALEMKVGGVLT